MERELTAKKTFDSLSKTNAVLKKEYPLQVNPREINLFYCSDHLRERIVCQGGQYHINNTDRSFTKAEILAELKAHPERFSPNVVMRSLYQEVVLPNLCFVGGASELSYWLQLKGCFDEESVPYPILVLRNSVLFISSKQKSKRERLGISVADLFLPQDALLRKKTRELSPLPLDFSKQKEELKSLFNSLKPLVQQTDASFKGALDAQEQKQLKGMKNLEKRLLKAEKKRLSDTLRRIQELQAALFPNEGLQERNINFSELYLTHGKDLIPFLMRTLDPLKPAFSVLEI
jgi:bacillithiol biosynthesis cysteine-adding enzyme BshC